MANGAVLCLLFVSGFCQKGLAAVIETQQTVMAAVGDKACLNCQLMQPKDVRQVSWQKVLPDKEQNIATYTKNFGEKVNPDFRDKVELKYAGLQNNSIVIRRVTEEDEGCYHCVFYTYPDGAFFARTCLQLYELHEPVLHVRESNSPEEAVVSCSATGRPAPTVTLTVPHYNSTSVTNTNATVTVTATAVLPRLHGNSTQVGCAVRVLSGPQIEVFTMIPEVTLSSADGEKHLGVNFILITVLVVVMSCVCVAAAVITLLKRKHKNGLSHKNCEENKAYQTSIQDIEDNNMANGAVLYLLFVSGLCQKGLAAVIETQQTVMAAVGEEALLNCQLMQPKDVFQVSWQKVLPEGEKNLASYNKYLGQKVNDGFQDKVEFKDAGLQNSSIVIRRVTEEDEGCYRCLYSTYPDGALIARTCLQLYELHEPVLHVRKSNAPEEAVVSCSATGRPAPTVTLTVPHYNSTSVTNTNATVTVTATAVLPRLHGNSIQVGCAVQVLSGPQIEVFTMIPEVTLSSADDVTLIIVLVMVSCVCVAVIIAGLLIQKHRNCLSHRDSEKNKTPQKTTEDTEEARTPLLSQENEVRQRISTGKKKENVSPKESSLRAGCQRQLSQQFTDTQ
ncbi:hypothetical protein ABVT39_006856 [Epinephelus coioides]